MVLMYLDLEHRPTQLPANAAVTVRQEFIPTHDLLGGDEARNMGMYTCSDTKLCGIM